jgi:hypothetical protein
MRTYITLLSSAVLWEIAARAPDDEGEPLSVIELEENLAEVDKPPELSPGPYKAEVQDVQINTSGKGNRYFAVKFVIPTENLPADMQENYPDGAVFYWNRNIVPNGRDRRALFNLRQFVEALGLDSNTSAIDPNEWMGRPATLRIRMGKYQGVPRAEIASVEAAEAERRPERGSGSAKKPSGRGGRRAA